MLVMTHSELIKQFILPSECQETIYQNIRLKIKRDDLIHKVVSGNKWRKLKGHLLNFNQSNNSNISSIGGVHSNHLHALAWTCHQLQIPCELYIYGHHDIKVSPTMLDCLNWNAKLHMIPRTEQESIHHKVIQSNGYWIGEGGTGKAAEIGIEKLVEEFLL